MKKILFSIVTFLISCIVSNAQDKNPYEVYALKYATLAKPSPVADWVAGGPQKDSVDIIFMFWLIKDKAGKNILVDAGCSGELQNAKDFGLYKVTRPDSVLLQIGVEPASVTDIIISHPHWDHIDGIKFFPNAQIWMQKDDYTYYVSGAWQKGGNKGGFEKSDVLTIVERNIAGKVTLVDGDNKEIFPGIKVFTGSRHTYNSQYVQVQSGNDRIIIASDNIWVYYSLEKSLPAPSYGTLDAKGYVATMQRMKTQASKIDYIIPGHDGSLFTKFPKVTPDIIRIK